VTENLSLLENEVAAARTKLASDLGILRSPHTYRKFTADLKSDAQSAVQRLVEDVKARAASNPTAALAIGAGLGWRLIKHPPIATALIGAGLLSLWRTSPAQIDEEDYLSTAKQRLGEQVSSAVETMTDYAAEHVAAAGEKVSAYAETARERSRGSRAQRLIKRSKLLNRRVKLRHTFLTKLSKLLNARHHRSTVL
jgi:hypothetical protein